MGPPGSQGAAGLVVSTVATGAKGDSSI